MIPRRGSLRVVSLGIRLGLVVGAMLLGVVRSGVAAPPGSGGSRLPGYGRLRIGMSYEATRTERKLTCLTPVGQVVRCHAAPDRRQHEKTITVWFVRGRASKIQVYMDDAWTRAHAEFVRPYIVELGPPDTSESMPIDTGPFAGWLVRLDAWQEVSGSFVSIASRKADPYGAVSQGFGLMFMEAAGAKALIEGAIAYERDGVGP